MTNDPFPWILSPSTISISIVDGCKGVESLLERWNAWLNQMHLGILAKWEIDTTIIIADIMIVSNHDALSSSIIALAVHANITSSTIAMRIIAHPEVSSLSLCSSVSESVSVSVSVSVSLSASVLGYGSGSGWGSSSSLHHHFIIIIIIIIIISSSSSSSTGSSSTGSIGILAIHHTFWAPGNSKVLNGSWPAVSQSESCTSSRLRSAAESSIKKWWYVSFNCKRYSNRYWWFDACRFFQLIHHFVCSFARSKLFKCGLYRWTCGDQPWNSHDQLACVPLSCTTLSRYAALCVEASQKLSYQSVLWTETCSTMEHHSGSIIASKYHRANPDPLGRRSFAWHIDAAMRSFQLCPGFQQWLEPLPLSSHIQWRWRGGFKLVEAASPKITSLKGPSFFWLMAYRKTLLLWKMKRHDWHLQAQGYFTGLRSTGVF